MKKSFDKMTDQEIKNYLMRHVKKDHIMDLIIDWYDLTYFTLHCYTKETLINKYFYGLKIVMQEQNGETLQEKYERLKKEK